MDDEEDRLRNAAFVVAPALLAALLLAACSEPDAIILKQSSLDPGVWYEVGRVTGSGDRNLSVCLDEYAPALNESAARLATGAPAKFSCAYETGTR